MPFLNEKGLQTFWDICRSWFANDLEVNQDSDKVTIEIKSNKDREESTELDSIDIVSATQTSSGVMSSSDKTKLDGIAEGATASLGTITGITTYDPLDGSGQSGSINISHKSSGVTARTSTNYGPTEDVVTYFGSSFNVPGYKVEDKGHLIFSSDYEITLPDNVATTSVSGLMSAEDKAKLDTIEEGADVTDIEDLLEKITASAPIKVSQVLDQDDELEKINISHNTSGVDAGTYGNIYSGEDPYEDDYSPAFGDDVELVGFSVNETGHITAASSYTVSLPSTIATTTVPGLLSPEDKAKLDTIETGATKQKASVSAPEFIGLYNQQGSSINYARQDHVHGIELATGDNDGQIKIAGENVTVKGINSTLINNVNSLITNIGDGSTVATLVNGKLSKSQNLGQIVWYAASGTADGTPTKVVQCQGSSSTSDYSLEEGTLILIKFTFANTLHSVDASNSIKLNIDNTGEKDVYVKGAISSTSNPCIWDSNELILFAYDGISYNYILSANSEGYIPNDTIDSICSIPEYETI